MVKCNTCEQKLEETFLNKRLGTMRKEEGKKLWICNVCQSKEDNPQ